MRGVLIVVVVVAGCGRLHFDDRTDAGSATGTDARGTGDGGAGGDAAMIDAAVTACAGATPIVLGTTTVNTCTGNQDLVDGCGPAGTKEIVLAFDPPATRGYQLAARDQGTMNVSNSTTVANATCTGTGSCAGILGTGFTAGQTVYIVLEASSGGCVTVDFNIQ